MMRLLSVLLRRLKSKRLIINVASAAATIFIFMHIRNPVEKTSNLNQLLTDLVRPDSNKQACIHPNLDPWNTNMMKHFHHVPLPKCATEEDWITVVNGSAYLTERSIKMHGKIQCQISFLKRLDDFNIQWYGKISLEGNNQIKLKDDFFKAVCSSEDDGAKYENIHAGISYNDELHKIKETRGKFLNVLMLGFDSVSHMTFIRKLPKTYKYFMTDLRGLVLDGYNIVGDGTPQAFFPLLTGKTELELPTALKRVKEKDFIDVHPLIWKEYKAKGYITSFSEDTPNIAMFTTRHVGFKKQPTDHFMRPFYLAVEKMEKEGYGFPFNLFTEHDKLCIGSKRKSRVFMDYVRQLYDMYPRQPKFIIGFNGDASHDDQNRVETADDDLFQLLKELEMKGNLKNTILILMSDHGARYKEVRAELQGKHEERLPFFGFSFPAWFEYNYPDIMRAFRVNTKRLVTPFDIHATFQDILKIIEFSGRSTQNLSSRGLSLFNEIPKSRTCAQADVPNHWCACLNWHSASKNDVRVTKAAHYVIDTINKYVSIEKSCSKLSLYNITRVLQFLPDASLVKFSGAADADGFNPKMADGTFVDKILYQIWFYTEPNKGHYEATVTYHVQNESFNVSLTDVSRINMYGHDADCIQRSPYDIRKFCYCDERRQV